MIADTGSRKAGSAWHADARALSVSGLSVREIAVRLGRSRGGVQYALQSMKDDKRRCPYCSALRSRHNAMCHECRSALHEVIRTVTEGAWAQGWTRREIVATLGWSPTSKLPVAQMRERGYDMPPRGSSTPA